VDFSYRCDGSTQDVAGEVRYNSTVPISALLSTLPAYRPSDLDGDGKNDVLWRNAVTGQNWLWAMDGASIIGQGPIPAVPPEWQIASIGDMNGDGKADILWRNMTTGQPWVWIMDGANIVNNGPLPTLADLNWQIVGLADMNGDGRADVVWRNTTTGQNWLWMMDASGINIGAQGPILTLDTAWEVQNLADLSGDGKADIVWRNTTSGQPWVWMMDANNIAGNGPLPTLSDLDWQIVHNR
jgi:hypothetical protein